MKNCLVIIDVQNGFLSDKTNHIPYNIKKLLTKHQFDVIVATQFKNYCDSPYIKKLNWSEFFAEDDYKIDNYIESVAEAIFEKNYYSCFTDEFKKYIGTNNIKKLYFVGIDTDCCVLKSVIDCFELDIDYAVIVDCCASNGGKQSHNAAIKVMERTIGEKYILKML